MELMTESDFLAFYDTEKFTGEEIFDQYVQTQALSGQREDSLRIADLVGRSERTVRDWISHDTEPLVITAYDTALNLDLLPLKLGTPIFDAINLYAAHVCWTGNFHVGSSTNANVVSNKETVEALEKKLSSVGVGTNTNRAGKTSDNFQMGLGENGYVIGKTLRHLGLSTANERRIPRYVEEFLDSDNEEVLPALRTFSRILLKEKGTVTPKLSAVRLSACRDEVEAIEYSESVLKLLQVSYPGIPVGDEHIRDERRASGKYNMRISMQKNARNFLEEQYPEHFAALMYKK